MHVELFDLKKINLIAVNVCKPSHLGSTFSDSVNVVHSTFFQWRLTERLSLTPTESRLNFHYYWKLYTLRKESSTSVKSVNFQGRREWKFLHIKKCSTRQAWLSSIQHKCLSEHYSSSSCVRERPTNFKFRCICTERITTTANSIVRSFAAR